MTALRLLLPALLLLAPLGAAETRPAPAAAPAAAPATAPAATPTSGEGGITVTPDAKPAAAPPPAHAEGSWLMAKYREGGFTMHIFLVVSIWLVAVLIERLVRLRRAGIVPDGLREAAEKAWWEGDEAALAKTLKRQPSVLADMIGYAWETRGASGADILAGAAEIASRAIRRQQGKLVPLAIITTLGPILGLFGTVVGLIESFEAMKTAGSMGDVKQIAGGIATAFICTATGMAVAMPALVGYHLLKLRTNQFLIALEQEFNGLITRCVIRAEGGAEQSA